MDSPEYEQGWEGGNHSNLSRFTLAFGIEEKALAIAEDREEGILIRPAVAVSLKCYAQKRRAEFLLLREVRKKMGLPPTLAHIISPRGAWRCL